MSRPQEHSADARHVSAETSAQDRGEAPGLPWFRTWPALYLFVIGCFVLYVVLLTVLSQVFS